MADTYTYRNGAELPDIVLDWPELDAGEHTYELELVNMHSGLVAVDAADITGSAGGVTISWPDDGLAITIGSYRLNVRAIDADGKARDYKPGDEPRVVVLAGMGGAGTQPPLDQTDEIDGGSA